VQFLQALLLDLELTFDLEHFAVCRAYERVVALGVNALACVSKPDGRKIQCVLRTRR